MTSRRYSSFLAAAALALAAPAMASPEAPRDKACFMIRDWDGWSAPGDGDTLYLRVGMRDVYEVGLTPGSRVRKRAVLTCCSNLRRLSSRSMCRIIRLTR